jgi:hypothetical protein
MTATHRRQDRRAYRDAPFLDDHHRSRQDRTAMPLGFAGLLRWFVDGYLAESPTDLHGAGVYVSRPARIGADGTPTEDVPAEHIGGSELGSPRHTEPARQLLENSARQVDPTDEHFVRPMRAALAQLAGRDGDAVFMARFLEQVGYARGDWAAVAERWFPLQPFVRRPFAEQALRRLYAQYRPAPPARRLPDRDSAVGWVDLSESQRTAELQGETP